MSVASMLRIARVFYFCFSNLSEFDVYHTGRLSHVLRLLLCLCAVWAGRELIAAVFCTHLWIGRKIQIAPPTCQFEGCCAHGLETCQQAFSLHHGKELPF